MGKGGEGKRTRESLVPYTSRPDTQLGHDKEWFISNIHSHPEIYTIASGEQSQLRSQSLGQRWLSRVRTLLSKSDNPNLIPGPPIEVRGEKGLHKASSSVHIRAMACIRSNPYHILVN